MGGGIGLTAPGLGDIYSSMLPSGYWVRPPVAVTAVATGTVSIGFQRCLPIQISRTTTFDRIACEVTTGGSAGSLVRLGIRSPTSEGLPGTLLLDAGTVDSTGTGILSITISQTLTPGLWWLVACSQVAEPTMRITSAITVGIPVLSSATTFQDAGVAYRDAGSVTGALPASFTVAATLAPAPLVWLRVA